MHHRGYDHCLPCTQNNTNQEKRIMSLVKALFEDILSEEAKQDFIKEVNDDIDIPIFTEKTEAKIIEALWNVVVGFFGKKLGL